MSDTDVRTELRGNVPSPTRAEQVRRLVRLDRVPPHLRLPLVVFVAAQLVYLFWWAAWYPALMSYDSMSEIWQVTTGHWTAKHSVAYDALIWTSLKVTGDVAALALIQTLAMSA